MTLNKTHHCLCGMESLRQLVEDEIGNVKVKIMATGYHTVYDLQV